MKKQVNTPRPEDWLTSPPSDLPVSPMIITPYDFTATFPKELKAQAYITSLALSQVGRSKSGSQ